MNNCEIFQPQSGDNFKLIFPELPISDNLEDGKSLTLSIYNTIIPGMSFNEEDLDWQSFKSRGIFSNLEYDPLTATFMIDNKFKNWKILCKWLKHINNNKDVGGKLLNDYITDSSLIIYGNYGDTILTLEFPGMFIKSLGSINLNQREGEQFLECEATFLYDYFDIV